MSGITDGTLEVHDELQESTAFEHLLDDAIDTTSGRTSKFDIDDVRRAATMIDGSKMLEQLATWRQEARQGRHPGGRPPKIDDRVILIVLLLLAREHTPLWATEMGAVLHRRLTKEARVFLGLPANLSGTARGRTEARRWYNTAWNAFHRMKALMDPYPDTPLYRLTNRSQRDRIVELRDPEVVAQGRERLNWFSDSLLEMTFRLLPRDVRRLINQHTTVGIDQTPMVAASPRGRSPVDKETGLELRVNPKTGKNYSDKLVLEQDSGWYPINAERREESGPESKPDKDFVWGRAGSIAVLVPNRPVNQAEFPNIALGFSMSLPGTQHVASETVRVLQSIADRGHTPGTVVADRLYFATLSPESLHIPVKEMGWSVITDYKKTGLGVKGGKAGAKQVEGRHYCAGTPEDLLNASVDAEAHTIDDDTYRKRLVDRTAFELRPKEKPDARGHTPMMCPAVGPNATLECPLRELHRNATDKIRIAVLKGNVPEAPDLICTQTSVDFGPEDGIRDAQLFRYQSKEWSDAYRIGRNTDESYHAYVKDVGHEAADTPARRRIRGFAAHQIMATMLLVSANIRKIVTFLTDRETQTSKSNTTGQNLGPLRKTRRRDREGLSNYKAKWPLKVLPGAPAGAELDPPLRT